MSGGQDDKGSRYTNIQEMWDVQLHNKQPALKVVDRVGSPENWYNKANQYWEKSQPSDNGVLGGFGHLSKKDTNYSLKFLLGLFQQRPKLIRDSVIDCGAGIGRISKNLLCQVFKIVDMVDQCSKLVNHAKTVELASKKNMRHFYVKGLQQFDFQEKYDCVWVQWVFSQLNDDDAVVFLRKAKAALNQGGVIILKENHCNAGFVVDKEDFSVTRSTELFKDLFKKAGLNIVKEETQVDWPQDLFTIRMYALD